MRVFLLLGVLVAASAQSCNLDSDCISGYYCRPVNSNSVSQSCQPLVKAGGLCVNNPLQKWLERRCDASLGLVCTNSVCAAGSPGNPTAVTGKVCGADIECGPTAFCKLTSSTSNTRNCVARSVLGQTCTYAFVDPVFESRCIDSLECRPIVGAAANQGTCQLTGTGKACINNLDCGSAGMFCKRVSEISTVKECFKRSVQGERCMRDGYVAEWDQLQCLDTLSCALLDNNNPGLGGVCHTRGEVCLADSDCGSEASFCRRISSTSFTKQCYTRSNVGQKCTIPSFTPDWESQLCASDSQCVEVDVNNPALQGICMPRIMACVNDLDCDPRQFCRRSSSTSNFKQCYERSMEGGQCSSAGFVPEWNEKKCLQKNKCVLISTSNPSLGGYCRNQTVCGYCDTIAAPVCAHGQEYYNPCHARCEGLTVWDEGPCNAQGCVNENDCKSESFFCKRAMITSSFKSCFLRSTEGQPCTWPGYATDWNERQCLKGMFCVLNDQNTPGLGGTCQAQEFGCTVDSDCRSNSQFCKRVSSTSSFKSCFEKSTQSQDCTIGTSVPEWNTKKCLDTLYCYPLNYNNPSAGGVCQSNTFYGSNGPNNVASTGVVTTQGGYQTNPFSTSYGPNFNDPFNAQYYNQYMNNGYPYSFYNNGYNNGFNNGYNIPFNYGQYPTNYNYNYNYNSGYSYPVNYGYANNLRSSAFFTCSRGCTGEGVPAQNGQKCYCDAQCVKGNDCCPDYQQYCASGFRTAVGVGVSRPIPATATRGYSRATAGR